MIFKRQGAAFLMTLLFVIATQIAANSAAQAAPRGELVASTYQNGLSPRGDGCGEYIVKFYNASNAPIFSAELLITIALDFKKAERPYRGSAKKSWVSYTMFLEPGGTTYFSADLCTTIPKRHFSNGAYEYTSFDVAKVRWAW